ncbi:GGDEF domain-containing protein [Agrobacterium sp. ES01]|uniref:GGDEF domain-containing protein n=1 Tax=Agrobacterium sp. ES01 TaxID=3420714 RepID=UPI003D134F1B
MTSWLGLDARPTLTDEERTAYDASRVEARAHVLFQTVTAICAFYLSYIVVDYLLVPDAFELAVLLRFGVVLPIAILLLAYLRSSAPLRHKEVAALCVSVSGNLFWCVIVVSSHNPSVLSYYYAALVFQAVIAIAAKTPFIPSLIASLVTFVINYSFIWFLSGSTPDYVFQHFVVYMPVFLLTMVTCHQLEAERLIVFKQAHENELLKAELSRQNEDLARLSFTDPLTRLANRRGTDAALAAMRDGKVKGLGNAALFIIDIDKFKTFNDNYGHAAGDHCLAMVAAALEQETAPLMHIGRHGGEEFLAFLPDCDGARASLLAKQLCGAVAAMDIRHDFTGTSENRITVSIGVACGSLESTEQTHALSKRADEALYAVKNGGRNGWLVAQVSRPKASSAA